VALLAARCCSKERSFPFLKWEGIAVTYERREEGSSGPAEFFQEEMRKEVCLKVLAALLEVNEISEKRKE
jgi:hypothetical protein